MTIRNKVEAMFKVGSLRHGSRNILPVSVGLLLQLTSLNAFAQANNAFAINNAGNYPANAFAQNSIAIGGNADVGLSASNSIALGYNASVIIPNSVAIGANAVASRGAQTYVDPFSGQTVSSVGEVSFGSSAGGAQLTNLAPGSAPTDAATVGQVQSATTAVLSQANTYTNNAVNGILSQAADYTNNATSGILSSAENYASSAASSALSSANNFTATSSATTLSAAQLYANGIGSSTLSSANNYTNTSAAATLSAADKYTDTSSASMLSAAEIYADSDASTALNSAETFATNLGSATLTSANQYTDASSAATLASANSYAYEAGVVTLAQANNYTYIQTEFLAAKSLLAPAQATGLETVSLGGGSIASGNNAIALGSNAQAPANGALAAGFGATVLAAGGVALGQNASVFAANSTALGQNSVAARGAQAGYVDPISGAVMNSVGEVSVGSPGAERQITNVAAGSAATDAANVGQVQNAEAIAVNLSESYTNGATNSLLSMLNSYGYNTSTGNGAGSVAIGSGASASGANASAIGSNSSASANNSVALGAGSSATRGAQTNYKDPISGNIASSVGEVSVGSPGAERQITNLAPGTAPTDAANVEQVQAAIATANAYTEAIFAKASRLSWSIEAAAQALADLPQAPVAGQSMIGLSMGTSHGEMGLAFGGSYFMPDNSVTIRASASYSGEGGVSAGMGVGISLN